MDLKIQQFGKEDGGSAAGYIGLVSLDEGNYNYQVGGGGSIYDGDYHDGQDSFFKYGESNLIFTGGGETGGGDISKDRGLRR